MPMYLKTLTVGGLPVEEIPCVEVWDLSGIVFASHVGLKPTSMCNWNAEYGDGLFKISQNIIGDFSIICRFGGHLASTKDKSTLIFKYQNSTAFLPNEVVVLKHFNCDINPQYLDSLDTELFTVHLMFGTNPDDDQSRKDNKKKNQTMAKEGAITPTNKDLEKLSLPVYHTPGVDAFEAGLDEISKHHPVMPEPVKCSVLLDRGCEDKYSTVAMQLANNNIEYAVSLGKKGIHPLCCAVLC